eukprot:20748-Heterococcus_DN1.PRE.1
MVPAAVAEAVAAVASSSSSSNSIAQLLALKKAQQHTQTVQQSQRDTQYNINREAVLCALLRPRTTLASACTLNHCRVETTHTAIAAKLNWYSSHSVAQRGHHNRSAKHSVYAREMQSCAGMPQCTRPLRARLVVQNCDTERVVQLQCNTAAQAASCYVQSSLANVRRQYTYARADLRSFTLRHTTQAAPLQ